MAAPVPLLLAVLVLFGGATGSDGFAWLLEVKKCVVTADQQAPVVLRSWSTPQPATSDEGGDDDLAALLEFKKGIVADQPVLGSWSPLDDAGGRGGAAPVACPSGWRGVVCDGGAVVAVALDGLGLSGELDLAPLARMRALKDLSLAGNAFSGRLPAAIGDFASLRHLDLSANRFDGPIPDRLAGLSGLVHLNLSHNNFSAGFPATVIQQLQHLRRVDLRGNSFSGSTGDLLAELRCAEYVDLRDNQFTECGRQGTCGDETAGWFSWLHCCIPVWFAICYFLVLLVSIIVGYYLGVYLARAAIERRQAAKEDGGRA